MTDSKGNPAAPSQDGQRYGTDADNTYIPQGYPQYGQSQPQYAHTEQTARFRQPPQPYQQTQQYQYGNMAQTQQLSQQLFSGQNAGQPDNPQFSGDQQLGQPYQPAQQYQQYQAQPGAGQFPPVPGQPQQPAHPVSQANRADTASNPFVNPAAGRASTVSGTAPSPADVTKGTGRTVLTSTMTSLLITLVVLSLGWLAVYSGVLPISRSSGLNPSTGSGGSTSTQIGSAGTSTWKTVAKNVAPSVVSITITTGTSRVMGSGVIIDKKGYIVTNNHVASNNGQMVVTMSNGEMYGASVVGTDPTTDLAVLKIDNPPSNLTAASFASSSNLAVGEDVMAIGNPLGYENTATTGVVSALNRPVVLSESGSSSSSSNTVFTNAVQIDAAINSGNSGGPSFNAEGKIIGINTAIASTRSTSGSSGSTGSIGIGFAIPSDTVKWVTEDIIKNGHVQHVSLGVTVQTDTAKTGNATRSGAAVRDVAAGSPAEAAGLKSGDTIVGYNGNVVGSMQSLLGYVRATRMGSRVTLTVIRDGRTTNLSATMDQAENSGSSEGSQPNDDSDGDNGGNNDGGNDDNNNNDDGSGN
ncbi:MAG: trypsin-like peptidase domain-containing protein [Scardovia wiggsiae]|uniref:S1C family serine protease n=1 Tax=Scardovia wiggsiae TaxID=230143 RepID=UPI001CB44B31|nr:trypsin-like peptidase domain-containing protein [Scardovia wiggsiae]